MALKHAMCARCCAIFYPPWQTCDCRKGWFARWRHARKLRSMPPAPDWMRV